jgi:hypothetical protein
MRQEPLRDLAAGAAVLDMGIKQKLQVSTAIPLSLDFCRQPNLAQLRSSAHSSETVHVSMLDTSFGSSARQMMRWSRPAPACLLRQTGRRGRGLPARITCQAANSRVIRGKAFVTKDVGSP